MSVFVFVVKEAFDLPCLPQDYKDEIEISKLVILVVEGLMIQQFRPSLNKQVISYVSKLFLSGITWDIYVHVVGHFFNPDDGKQPKTFSLNILIFF